MKRRMGFVSNSSSSSYVVLFTQEQFDKMLEGMNAFEKAIVELLDPTKKKCFENQNIVAMSWWSGSHETFSYRSHNEDEKLAKLLAAAENRDPKECEDELFDAMYETRQKVWSLASKIGFAHSVDDS